MVRVKRRYIVVKLVSKRNQDSFSDHEILNEITDYVSRLYGDFGVGCLKRSFSIKKHDSYHGYIIVQVRKGVHEIVMSAIPLITKINEKQCQLSMVHLSGTIRSSLKILKQNYIMSLRAAIAKKTALDAEMKAKAVAIHSDNSDN